MEILNISKQTVPLIQLFVSWFSTDLKYQQIIRPSKIGFVAFYVSEKILIAYFALKTSLFYNKPQKQNTTATECPITYKTYLDYFIRVFEQPPLLPDVNLSNQNLEQKITKFFVDTKFSFQLLLITKYTIYLINS